MKKFILSILVLATLAIAQIVEAVDSMSWTDDHGTFVLNLSRSTWSLGQMSGQLGSVENVNGAIFFDGSGDASVSGHVFGDQGSASIQSNAGSFTVSGTVH